MNILEKQKYLFANFFLISNKLQTIGNSNLTENDVTVKQWFLILIVSQFNEKPPMLTEVANLMGTSRQNTKQLALKLQEKGFLIIERDQKDSRTLRLKLTEKNKKYWEERQEKDQDFITRIFNTLSSEELDIMCQGFSKVLEEINKI